MVASLWYSLNLEFITFAGSWGCVIQDLSEQTVLRRKTKRTVLTAFSLVMISAVVAGGADPVEPCEANGQRPFIVLTTQEGEIGIELLPEAAPAAVKRLSGLVQGPIFLPDVTQYSRVGEEVGYYDGLVFEEAVRGTYVSTSVRPPSRAVLIETEIDADALGLDQLKITASEEAMFVWQHELLPYQTKLPDDSLVPPKLMGWLQTWSTTFDAGFLLGVSRKEINEVLGYDYRSGLDSRPVARGAVSLEPSSPRWSTPRLTIALKRIPTQDGRRMVIGHVAEGLEIADRISTGRLSAHKAVQYRLLVPIRIFKARIECRVLEPQNSEEEGAP